MYPSAVSIECGVYSNPKRVTRSPNRSKGQLLPNERWCLANGLSQQFDEETSDRASSKNMKACY
jgi:hypothetical protein